MLKVVLLTASVCVLAGCSSGGNAALTKADITKISQVKSTFGPEFKIIDVTKRPIDPKFFSARQLPQGLKFEPPKCAKAAVGQDMPSDLQGSMAAVSAEGDGNRFVVIAVETSKPLPVNQPGKDCTKVAFVGDQVRGGFKVVDAPHIDGVHTLGIHRILQADVNGGGSRTGELYDYSAQFGDYQVIVIANPLVVPDQPVSQVDTQRARDLLVKAVAAIRS
ncbi:DUF5642 family protein [Mycobacterium malmoense]|uniref:DUF5642 domain-containing protein n=1 Tax=Mycobacterium malmoense TaxID=1780 RepID=A0ABX3SMB9_MYCMA|nr:DUF5642 family protein [Mycobacterium malmoense]OIN81375.1 hypothetical protein BMG05_07865 [Mycobacterium malmoense]ORA79100.1 hypothetical protein BST29_19805 [Mycobacterium malmoense]QZA19526.1 DUF5642 family protein [Mycobacterium malmoense]UNB96280.1 DUF5642 family protein [Mycobacterium malmoense]